MELAASFVGIHKEQVILLWNGVGCFFCSFPHTHAHTQNLEWRFIALKMSQHPQKKMVMWKVDRQNLAGLNDLCTSLVKSGTPDQRRSFRPPFSKHFPRYFHEMNPCSETTPLKKKSIFAGLIGK